MFYKYLIIRFKPAIIVITLVVVIIAIGRKDGNRKKLSQQANGHGAWTTSENTIAKWRKWIDSRKDIAFQKSQRLCGKSEGWGYNSEPARTNPIDSQKEKNLFLLQIPKDSSIQNFI